MTAVAQFSCRTNSHPFQDRHVSLTEPAKIGRSVARCRPTANNAVFDCKVLSRNHALLWYENGKFYLQDTRSSNGTFVNNQRLSKASEKSPAVEVNSCDIVQFGVDVVDNTRKVTHGCIVSQLRLYLPNGEECKQSNCAWNNQIMEKVPFNNVYPTVQAQDLHQLHQYLQEALHREQMLEQKLALLQRLVLSSHDASEKGWQALIDEDRLLSRLEFLENQLQAFNKTQDEDTLQSQLQQIQEEKFNYENTYKETLRQALQEKLEAAQKLSNVERSLSNTEDECTHLRHLYEQAQNDMSNQALSHQTKVEEISEKIQAADRQLSESKSVAEKQGLKMQKEIDDLVQNENMLNQAIESLKEENNRLQDEASQLHQIQMQLDQVSSEKAEEQKSRIAAEKEVLKFQEEKDRQNTALTETSRELLAALSDRENLIEREEKLRSVVEESEHMLKLCQSTSESESEERLEENKITSESFVIFKAKLKELKEQLRESNKCLENVQEENIILKEELAASKEIASIIPQLQNKLVTLQSELHNREQECVYLSAQVKQAEQSVHDIQQEMMSLKGKLVEEQKAIAKNSTLTEELRENCTTQALQIEKACKQEKETLSQLSVVKEQLTLKESEVHSLKEELMACSDLKDALLSKTDSLTDSLMEFEHEKITISDELQGLRVEKEKMQEALSTEIEQNESYRELSIKEHGKWDSVLQQKDEELKQLAEQCQELIQECKINSQKLEKSFFGRRVMLLTLMIVAVSFFYFFLFANHTPQQPS